MIEGDYDLSFKEAIQVLKTEKSSEEIEEEAQEFLALLENDFDLKDEEGILYYIAGFLSRSDH